MASTAGSTRLLALLNIAQADALIANQLWKYTYGFWRHVTAIRWENNGNPDTARDAARRPFLVTPPYPHYPCAWPTAGAAAEVLRQFGTDDVAFVRTFNAPAVPLPAPMPPLPAKAITRIFASLSEAVGESRDARVFAGRGVLTTGSPYAPNASAPVAVGHEHDDVAPLGHGRGRGKDAHHEQQGSQHGESIIPAHTRNGGGSHGPRVIVKRMQALIKSSRTRVVLPRWNFGSTHPRCPGFGRPRMDAEVACGSPS